MVKAFRYMEADLSNLVPEAAETNRLRSNYDPAMVPDENRAFEMCDIKIENRTFEPRPEIRGDEDSRSSWGQKLSEANKEIGNEEEDALHDRAIVDASP